MSEKKALNRDKQEKIKNTIKEKISGSKRKVCHA